MKLTHKIFNQAMITERMTILYFNYLYVSDQYEREMPFIKSILNTLAINFSYFFHIFSPYITQKHQLSLKNSQYIQ